MNINDFDIPIPDGDRLEILFNHQSALMHKYHPIEEANMQRQLLAPGPVDLNDRFGQARLKDFAWRITEELAEATECLVPMAGDIDHYREEVIDALHFTVEELILCGMTPDDLIPEPLPRAMKDKLEAGLFEFSAVVMPEDLENNVEDQLYVKENVYLAIEKLGCAMNCLKNKPWKSTHMLTDIPVFRLKMKVFFRQFLKVCFISGFQTSGELVGCYLNKNAVNQFRIRTNY